MNNRSLTEILSKWMLQWRAQGLPAATLGTAQYYVLDWLGSALAGTATRPGKMLLDYAGAQPQGACQIVGLGQYRSADTAAFVNGALSHIVEMDDLDRDSVVHPGTVVIPAALAVAERLNAPSHDFLAAVVAGYEVAIRVGTAVGKQHYFYFHNTATCGVFGAAAAAGWLLGLNAQQMVWALGNAGTQAAGLWQFNSDGDMSKHLHAGHAASAGVRAADLAGRGFSGARLILEGERGFFAAAAPDADPAKVTADLNFDAPIFKIGGVSIKPHASCRHTHPAVDAALALREQINGRTITHVQIDTYQAALDLCDNPTPQTPYVAKFSLHYCVSAALAWGHAGLTAFDQEALRETAVRKLLSIIQVNHDIEFERLYPQQWPARVTLTLEDGTRLSKIVRHPKGDPENPLTADELETKFRQLAAYGGYADKTETWLDWVAALCPDSSRRH